MSSPDPRVSQSHWNRTDANYRYRRLHAPEMALAKVDPAMMDRAPSPGGTSVQCSGSFTILDPRIRGQDTIIFYRNGIFFNSWTTPPAGVLELLTSAFFLLLGQHCNNPQHFFPLCNTPLWGGSLPCCCGAEFRLGSQQGSSVAQLPPVTPASYLPYSWQLLAVDEIFDFS